MCDYYKIYIYILSIFQELLDHFDSNLRIIIAIYIADYLRYVALIFQAHTAQNLKFPAIGICEKCERNVVCPHVSCVHEIQCFICISFAEFITADC